MFEGGSSEKLDAGSEKEADHEDGSAKSTILQKFSPHLVKSILELLCDESVSLPQNNYKLKEVEVIHLFFETAVRLILIRTFFSCKRGSDYNRLT